MTASSPLQFNTAAYGPVFVEFESYTHGGGIAVELYNAEGEYVTTLSVNLPEFSSVLCEGEFFAKTWSENEEIASEALASGLFEDTGRSMHINWVSAPIWKLRQAIPNSQQS